ncbi:MAG: amino acid ABC transporter permease [Hyphomicrobiales bacterium]|jgi:general L-amino acid transport system permease protein|nr:amino acid ABC transporter permease [Hyphomicrobiales bacterium]
MSVGVEGRPSDSKVVFYNDPRIRSLFFQLLLLAAIVALFWFAYDNTVANLKKRNIAQGFAFWDVEAGFDISQTLISYSAASSYGRAFWVGLLNTMLVSLVSIFFATILGVIIGILRLSKNWLVAKLAMVYVEIFRNVPLLLILYFWYRGVLGLLPEPRESIKLPADILLNTRGLLMPKPIFAEAFIYPLIAFVSTVILGAVLFWWARRVQARTGKRPNAGLFSIGMVIGVPLIVFFLSGSPLSFDIPVQGRFNASGGMTLPPEFVSMVIGLTTYTAAFIAENVRAGIVAISKGQTEAAQALGLSHGQTIRLVIMPQALRVIIPLLNSEYLSLTKNSSLGVSIGYPDLVNVFTGTVLNQTGQAVEMVSVTMLVYLTLSLLTSAFMNWFNRRVALVER